MSRALFYKYFAAITFGLATLIFLLSLIPIIGEYQFFSYASWAFFTLFTLGVYFLAEKAAHSPNLNTFSSVILGVVFMKMVFIVVIILAYKKLATPASAWFLLPFFIIYLAFTIFEVYFLNKLGRIKPGKSEVQSSGK